ncbi:OmpA family protein [Archangium violaceum]|uniref:OmpA family protein n=1 Tax=Archangium violaceum TaxID=83451 RepID=UPI00193C16E8|nr:OmpA family protein [Archangium violaceum]QRK06967.1 OmpA family protein [Archangium violaceum]
MCPRPSPRMLLALAVLAASPAWTQDEPTPLPGFELERLDPNPGLGSLLVGSGETLPIGGLRLMLLGNYQHQPLRLLDEEQQLEIVKNRVVGVLSGSYGVFSWLEVGAQLPVVLWQRGEDPRIGGFTTLAPQGLGTPQVHARLGLLSQRAQQPVDLSMDLVLGIPVGSADALSRDPGLRFLSRVVLGGRMGQVRPSLEAGVLLHPSVPLGASVGAKEIAGPEIRVGLGLSTVTAPLRGELSARASLPSTSPQASVEVMGGLRYQIRPGMELFGMGGPGFGLFPGTPLFRVVAGLTYTMEPPPRLVFIDEIPARQLQLQEAVRQAMRQAEEDARGPRPVSVWELNALSLEDPDKMMPDPRPLEGSTGSSGPPEPYEGEARPFQPSSPERLVLRGTVLFEQGSAKLPDSLPLLDQMAQILQELPESATVLIEGHSDAEGSVAYRRALSMLRAKAVRKYLIYRGVAAKRLQLRGFGADWPASTNTTEEGRRLNRRAELLILTAPPPGATAMPVP